MNAMTDNKRAALDALRNAPDKATRDARALDAIRAGADLDETGQAAGVTRERIRQLVREAAAHIECEPRNLLRDVRTVCQDTETAVKLPEVRRRLRALAPDHAPYWPGMGLLDTQIGEQLCAAGVRVRHYNGRPVALDVDSLHHVLMNRERIERWRKRAEPGSPIATLIARYDVLTAETWRPDDERALYLEGFASAIDSLATTIPNDSFISYDDLSYTPKEDNRDAPRA